MAKRCRVIFRAPQRMERVHDPHAPLPDELAIRHEVADYVRAAIRSLPSRTMRRTIRCLHGITDGSKPDDMIAILDENQMARAHHTTRERVRGIHAHAKHRLWHRLRRRFAAAEELIRN